MRLSYKKYPILNQIEDNNTLALFQEQGLSSVIMKTGFHFNDILAHTSSVVDSETIDFVSVPFSKKGTKGKLVDLFTKIDSCEGIMLYQNIKFSKIHAVSYQLIPSEDKKELSGEIHLYNEAGRIVILLIEIKGETTNWKSISSSSINKNSEGDAINLEQLEEDWYRCHIQTLLSTIIFKQFAEIKVKRLVIEQLKLK